MAFEKVLLVEDSRDMQILVRAIVGDFCELDVVANLEDAKSALNQNQYALIILDVVLPDGDGFQFCQNLRSKGRNRKTPLIFLTGETALKDKVYGFALGADDYITKPFEPEEFAARIKSKLRREQGFEKFLNKLGLRVDADNQRAYLKENNKEEKLNLTPTEFKLLNNFIRNPDVVLSRQEIKETVWGKEVHISNHTVDTHISSLRKKMGPTSNYLKAIPKKGYTFVSELDERAPLESMKNSETLLHESQ